MSGEDSANSGNVAGAWKDERICMTHLASFSRSSTYVRSLVRQQFRQQGEPTSAWERLRERLAKSGDVFDYDEETPNFVKKKEAKRDAEKQTSEGEDNGAVEDEDDEEEETAANLKALSPERTSSTSKRAKEEDSYSPSLYSAESSARDRRQSMPQNSARVSNKQFTLGSTDVHSKILNRRLSLAENVIKNYSKYIRTPDETHSQQEKSLFIKVEGDVADTLGESGKVRRGSKQPSAATISEELDDDSTQEGVAIAILPTPNPLSPQTLLTIPDGYTPGSSYSVPPTPVAIRQNSLQEPPTNVRRYSLSSLNPDPNSDGLFVIRSRTDLTRETTSRGADVQPRLIRTSRGEREIVYPDSRSEAIKELRQEYRALAKNKRLNDVVVFNKGATFYEMLQKDRERRDRESAIFRQEMEEIMASLKGINVRLDQRIKVLDCSEPPLPKINPQLHRLVQQAMLGIAPENNSSLMQS